MRVTADAIGLSRRTLSAIEGDPFRASACSVAAIPPAAAG